MTPAQAIAYRAVELGAMQKEDELAAFVDELLALQPQRILEIGSFMGGTCYAWRATGAAVWSVDLNGGAAHGAAAIVGDSHDARTRAAAAAHAPYDVVFIDGDHSHAGVKQDLADYAPLAPNGLVALHDIVRRHDEPSIEVWRLWAQLPASQRRRAIITRPPTWGGIGVLYLR